MTETNHVADLQVAVVRVQQLDAELTKARAHLGATILAARASGMTVPAVADALGQSEANVSRIQAKARKATSNGATVPTTESSDV